MTNNYYSPPIPMNCKDKDCERITKASKLVLSYLNFTVKGEVRGCGAATASLCVDILKEALEPVMDVKLEGLKVEDLPF